jgi:hypothetical protein
MKPWALLTPVVNCCGILFKALSGIQACVVLIFMVSMMVPARIDRCLICRSKLVHKKKILVGGMYTGDWLLNLLIM